MRKREARFGLLFITPWIIGVLLFNLFPFIASFALSFTRYNVVEAPVWVGMRNYNNILTDDPCILEIAGQYRGLCLRLSRDSHHFRFRPGAPC